MYVWYHVGFVRMIIIYCAFVVKKKGFWKKN